MIIVGHCPHCGSPIYSPSDWMAVTPPPAYRTCACVPQAQVVTTNNSSPLPGTLAPWCGICQGNHIPGQGPCTATYSIT